MKQSVHCVLTLVLCCALSLSGVLVGVPAARAAGTGSWTAVNTGLTYPYVTSLAINPLTPTTLYAGTAGGGVFRSTGGGATWTAVNTGLTDTLVISLAINPLTPGTLYAGTRDGGVFRSTDSGDHWTALNTGLTELEVLSLAIDPLTPAILYAGTNGGVFRSADAGSTWTGVNTGLTNPYVSSLAINPLTPTTLYAGTDGGGVFRSTNSGAIWTAGNTGLTNTHVLSLAINPATPSTLYAGTWGGGGGGVFRSTNSGMSWTAVNTWLTEQWVASLAINPLTPTTVYAGTLGEGVFRSMDSGTTWTAMNTGLTNQYVDALAINPLTPAAPYAGTGGGVFQYVTVPVRTLQSISITPNPASIRIGGTQQFMATGTYNFAPLSEILTSLVTWSANAPAGLFAGTAVGSFPVTATLGVITGSATVNVTALTRGVTIIDPTGTKLIDSTADITQDYYSTNPTLTTEGVKATLNDGDYVYNMGDIITGKLTDVNGVETGPTSAWKVSLVQFPNKVIDFSVVSPGLGTFTIGTANVHYDGPYYLRVESLGWEFPSFDWFNNTTEGGAANLYIKYNVAWVQATITPGPQLQSISGYVTRGNGQTVDVPMFVGVAYPGVSADGSLAFYYSVSPVSSGQFTMTFLGKVNPGLYRVFIMDGYYDTANDPAVVGTVMNYSHGIITLGTNPVSNFVLDHDAMIYKTISTIPTAFALTTTASPSAGGSIGRSPNAASYVSGTVVTLTANANPGYHFVNWSGDLTGTTNPTTITMAGNKTIAASFAPVSSTSLSLSAGWNLISVPVALPVSSISGLQAVYGYHDGWSIPATLTPGEAYWVQVQDAVIVPLPGTPSTTPVSLTYQVGWQLLGNPFDVPLPISSNITNHEYITTCYSYDPQLGWGVVDLTTGVLQPGRGYWIYLTTATTLMLTYP